MDAGNSSELGPLLSFVGGVIGSVLTAFTTIYVARYKKSDDEEDSDEERPTAKAPARRRQPRESTERPNGWLQVGFVILCSMPFILGVVYYLVSQSFPDTWLALVLTILTGLVMMMFIIVMGISAGAELLDLIEPLGAWVSPLTLRGSLLGMLLSSLITIFFIYLYDAARLPFTHSAAVRQVKGEFEKPFQNTTRGTLLVTVAAVNSAGGVIGNTMCAAIAQDRAELPHNRNADCSSKGMVALVSFNVGGHHTGMSFVVPAGWWYNVTIDGGAISPTFWVENAIR